MIQVDLNLDLKDLEQKLSPENHKRAMRYMLDNQVLADMTIYVPLLDGSLRTSGTVEDHETLSWETPYAAAQHAGSFVNKKGTHVVFANYTEPGTGAHWDLVAQGNHMDDWLSVYLIGAGLK